MNQVDHTHCICECAVRTKRLLEYTQASKQESHLQIYKTLNIRDCDEINTQSVHLLYVHSVGRLYLYFCCWCSSSSSFVSPIQLKFFVLFCVRSLFFHCFVSLFKLNCIRKKSSKWNARHAATIKEKKQIIGDHIESSIEWNK